MDPEFLLEGRTSRCQRYLTAKLCILWHAKRGCQSVLAYSGFLEFITLSFLARIPLIAYIHTYLVIFIYLSCFINVLLAVYWDDIGFFWFSIVV